MSRILLFPESDPGIPGSNRPPAADDEDIEPDDDPEPGSEAEPESGPEEEKPGKGKGKEKPKGKPKAVSLSATELQELQAKAAKYDQLTQERQQADQQAQRARENELAKTNPVKALEQARRRYEGTIEARQKEIDRLAAENKTLRARLEAGILDTGIKETISHVASELKLKVKPESIPYIVRDIAGGLAVEEDEDGNFHIFDKSTNQTVDDILKDRFSGPYKALFTESTDMRTPGLRVGNRRDESPPKRPSIADAYKKQVEIERTAEGVIPARGLKRPSKTA